jgi:hypothetical protein
MYRARFTYYHSTRVLMVTISFITKFYCEKDVKNDFDQCDALTFLRKIHF